ncbi:S9 family peptidase [Frankia sp. AgB32]|uniref:alpha/beta hydrolase family protein n=1 Tax=Frankia sp. AgB32 TaxID=631119 RepID=UPI00200EE00A|nr:lipase [Frankia sp. AgB32]MCK9895812.1 lipase [Frankia sp. AgB32]
MSWKPLATLADRADVDSFLRKESFDAGTDRYGVSTYQLVYRTVDPAGTPTTASGLLAVPRSDQRLLETVSFAHGTEIFKGDAPSTSSDGFLTAPPVTFASAGFAAVAPDYLGLGVGPGPHPWMDVPSETTASLDLLRAARTFLAGRGIQLRREVLATGFSQGASAALGLGRALTDGADPWFRLGALAPISGAYDFQNSEIPAALGGELNPKFSTVYMAYLLVAFNRLHHLYDTPGEVFQPPYVNIADLFDGTHPGLDALNDTPDSLTRLLTPRGLALLAHPTGAFATALAELDSVCSDWTPTAPVRLELSPGDEQAANANSTACRDEFAARGVQVPLVDMGVNRDYSGFVHEGSELLGTAATARWFLTLR